MAGSTAETAFKVNKKRKTDQDENEVPVNEFELARQQRIQRNKQVMADMGLEDAAYKMIGGNKQPEQHQRSRPVKPKEEGVKEPLQPTRRSRRLATQAADGECCREQQDQQFEELTFNNHSQASRTVKQRRVCGVDAASKLEPSMHHQHNMHRINSMSEKALITRAWKITNVSKLKSFIEVLEAASMETVLREAKEALAHLTGSCS